MKKLLTAIVFILATTISASAAELPAVDGFPAEWKKVKEETCTVRDVSLLLIGYTKPERSNKKILVFIKREGAPVVQIQVLRSAQGRVVHYSVDLLNGDRVVSFVDTEDADSISIDEVNAAYQEATGISRVELESCPI